MLDTIPLSGYTLVLNITNSISCCASFIHIFYAGHLFKARWTNIYSSICEYVK